MVQHTLQGCYLIDGQPVAQQDAFEELSPAEGREKTIAYRILRAHDSGEPDGLRLRFDALISHDITYVGIIQTARASGLCEFPVPYALTNCHNSLCAVGGTINSDDHAFGLSAAMKYGGIYVPANLAVIHQYARERMACCGSMILGSDSHTRYGAYGCMGIGEGGGELVKQLLKNTYDLPYPEVVLVWLEGSTAHGIGPQDIALALVAATFPDGSVKNKILEFAGPGLKGLSSDFRMGIDVMTTETACLSSIWATDEKIEQYYHCVGRPCDYKKLEPLDGAYYDSVIRIDLSSVESMIALPFHPSLAIPVHQLQAEPESILSQAEKSCNEQLDGTARLDLTRCIRSGKVFFDQGIIVGCSGGMFENISEAADILEGSSVGNGFFDLSVYPASAPLSLAITQGGIAERLMKAGAVVKPAFCGPCFGAGDTPAHNTLSVRHATRNFASREGSKPSDGQISGVALMDARSIAATAANAGQLTAATDIPYTVKAQDYQYDDSIYKKRVYNGFGNPMPDTQLLLGPNIRDWPVIQPLRQDLLIRLAAVIQDDVTTTDELIPSGETSSLRSNPIKLAEFTLSRRYPSYVANSKAIQKISSSVQAGQIPDGLSDILKAVTAQPEQLTVGSCIFAKRPGDGSAREQAASCQKVLGGWANICYDYATKRYRSNCINWGIVPFTVQRENGWEFSEGDWIYIPGIRYALEHGTEILPGTLIRDNGRTLLPIELYCSSLTDRERRILLEGCLINYYASINADIKK